MEIVSLLIVELISLCFDVVLNCRMRYAKQPQMPAVLNKHARTCTLRKKCYNNMNHPHPASFCHFLDRLVVESWQIVISMQVFHRNLFDGKSPHSFNDFFLRVWDHELNMGLRKDVEFQCISHVYDSSLNVAEIFNLLWHVRLIGWIM